LPFPRPITVENSEWRDAAAAGDGLEDAISRIACQRITVQRVSGERPINGGLDFLYPRILFSEHLQPLGERSMLDET